MSDSSSRNSPALPSRPQAQPASFVVLLRRSLMLMKPVTWFAPAWAFLCGALASGQFGLSLADTGRLLIGIIMAGPVLVGLSQVVNDYCDRDVDAINEPHRLIPSGLVSPRQVLITTIVLTLIGVACAHVLGGRVVFYVGIGLVCALSYSMHPLRFKRNGWIGNALVAFSYEGLAWLAGHEAFAPLSGVSLTLALLYSLGAPGIMTVNDFKSIEGDKRMGINTIPVLHGPYGAAWLAVLTMDLAQLAVVVTLWTYGARIAAGVVLLFILAQLPLQVHFIRNPIKHAVFYSATGVMLFVWGMLAAAIGL